MCHLPGRPTSRIDVLIANELPLHREVLASTFRTMRPDLLVHAIAHDELDLVICELRPLMVICSVINPSTCACSLAWITLYPDDRDEAVVQIDGVQRTIPNASIHQLLGVMDEVRSSR
jgi:hypothetical protein